jgi:hypothetical protein
MSPTPGAEPDNVEWEPPSNSPAFLFEISHVEKL